MSGTGLKYCHLSKEVSQIAGVLNVTACYQHLVVSRKNPEVAYGNEICIVLQTTKYKLITYTLCKCVVPGLPTS